MYDFDVSKLFLNGQDPETASVFQKFSQLGAI